MNDGEEKTLDEVQDDPLGTWDFWLRIFNWLIGIWFVINLIWLFVGSDLNTDNSHWGYYISHHYGGINFYSALSLIFGNPHGLLADILLGGITFGLILYIAYVALCIFIKWLRAWKPLPKFFPFIARIVVILLLFGCSIMLSSCFSSYKELYFNSATTLEQK